MVENTRTPTGDDPFQPVNLPVSTEVQESVRERPLAVKYREKWRKVASIEEVCSLDEEWWRDLPIQRMYYRVTIEEGESIVVFRDMVDGQWYTQTA